MDKISESEFDNATPPERPSMMQRFWRGFGSGAVNGTIMMGIFSGISVLALGVAAFHLAPILIGVATTSLFGGVMAVKHAMEEAYDRSDPTPSRRVRSDEGMTPVLVPTLADAVEPTLNDSPEMVAGLEAEQQQNWAARTGRANTAANANRPTAQNRIQQIISNRSMNDKSRASALLAEREDAAAQPRNSSVA